MVRAEAGELRFGTHSHRLRGSVCLTTFEHINHGLYNIGLTYPFISFLPFIESLYPIAMSLPFEALNPFSLFLPFNRIVIDLSSLSNCAWLMNWQLRRGLQTHGA